MLRATRVRTSSGEIGVLDWGGTGSPLVLLHPNGFCAGLYEPLSLHLRSRAHVLAIDLPGHGASAAPVTRAGYSFAAMATTVLEALDRIGIDRAIVVGGSLGGAVAIMADQVHPGRWTRALLAEPVAFPGYLMAAAPGKGNPMAEAARRRRTSFPDRAAMIAALSTREPLDRLAPEAMDAYALWGSVDGTDGIRLACDPEVEATVFEVSSQLDGAPAAWEHLREMSCPTTIVAGRSTFLPDVFAEQAERVGAPLVLVDGGHFVLHEQTDRGVGLIVRYALGSDARLLTHTD
jgi:pimeloyl-ACP methyl ester carboxylesterase